jgi:integrase
VKILKEVAGYDNTVMFPGVKRGKPISEASVRMLLRDTHDGLTVHGFRSSFRDWCAEMTNYPREVAEAALAHVLKDKTEAAYQRGDIFEKRRKLMDAWEDYCLNGAGTADIVPIKKKA